MENKTTSKYMYQYVFMLNKLILQPKNPDQFVIYHFVHADKHFYCKAKSETL